VYRALRLFTLNPCFVLVIKIACCVAFLIVTFSKRYFVTSRVGYIVSY